MISFNCERVHEFKKRKLRFFVGLFFKMLRRTIATKISQKEKEFFK